MNEYFIVYTYMRRVNARTRVTETVREVVEADTAKEAISKTLDEGDTLVDIRRL